MKSLLEIKELSISFGGIHAVQSVSLRAERGRVLSIIGPNGAGKTTLFNMISGLYKPDSGSICLRGEDVTHLPAYLLARAGVSRTFQNLQVFMNQTVLENVMVGRTRWEHTSLLADLLHLPSVMRQNKITEQHAFRALERVGMAQYHHRSAHSLSYGSMKRLELARALVGEPDLLLLDEPAAGCNAVETEEIESVISNVARADDSIAIVLIEHDMKMVMRISDDVLVLNQGAVLDFGSPESVRQNPDVIKAYLGTTAVDKVAYAAG